MTASQTSALPRPPVADAPSRIARVIGVGQDALRIDLDDTDVRVPYTQCSTAVHSVQPGDRVLVRTLEGRAIVEARLMREGETPVRITQDAQGDLTLAATGALRLRTPKAEIRIDADGDLSLTAHNIDSDAEQENRLTGRVVKLS